MGKFCVGHQVWPFRYQAHPVSGFPLPLSTHKKSNDLIWAQGIAFQRNGLCCLVFISVSCTLSTQLTWAYKTNLHITLQYVVSSCISRQVGQVFVFTDNVCHIVYTFSGKCLQSSPYDCFNLAIFVFPQCVETLQCWRTTAWPTTSRNKKVSKTVLQLFDFPCPPISLGFIQGNSCLFLTRSCCYSIVIFLLCYVSITWLICSHLQPPFSCLKWLLSHQTCIFFQTVYLHR